MVVKKNRAKEDGGSGGVEGEVQKALAQTSQTLLIMHPQASHYCSRCINPSRLTHSQSVSSLGSMLVCKAGEPRSPRAR